MNAYKDPGDAWNARVGLLEGSVTYKAQIIPLKAKKKKKHTHKGVLEHERERGVEGV